MNGRRKIAVEDAARENLAGVTRAVKLELVHPVLSYHFLAGLLKKFVITRRGQRESALHRLQTRALSRGNPLLFRHVITTPGREPNTDAKAIFRRRPLYTCKTVGKSGVEIPDCMRIVPAVVHQK